MNYKRDGMIVNNSRFTKGNMVVVSCIPMLLRQILGWMITKMSVARGDVYFVLYRHVERNPPNSSKTTNKLATSLFQRRSDSVTGQVGFVIWIMTICLNTGNKQFQSFFGARQILPLFTNPQITRTPLPATQACHHATPVI